MYTELSKWKGHTETVRRGAEASRSRIADILPVTEVNQVDNNATGLTMVLLGEEVVVK